jgi:hypothetical protein
MRQKQPGDPNNVLLDDQVAGYTDRIISGIGTEIKNGDNELTQLEEKVQQLNKLLNAINIDTQANNRIKGRLQREWETTRKEKVYMEKDNYLHRFFSQYRKKRGWVPMLAGIVLSLVLIIFGLSQISTTGLTATAGQLSGGMVYPFLVIIIIVIIIVYLLFRKGRM